MLLEVSDVCISFQEPKEFINDGFKVEFFSGEHWESFAEIHAHLIPEDTHRPGTCAIIFANTLL
jgi:hypothetical protein